MEKSKTADLALLILFTSVILGLGIFIQLYPPGEVNMYASYAIVAAGFLYALASVRSGERGVLIPLAFLFMLAADYFLVILDDKYELAVSLFSVVQLIFAGYLLSCSGKRRAVLLTCIRLLVVCLATAVVALIFKEDFDFLTGIAAFYFTNLIVNIIYAGLSIKRTWRLFLGLIFLAICDFFIGIDFLDGILGFNPTSASVDFVWIAYPPSVYFLALQTKTSR